MAGDKGILILSLLDAQGLAPWGDAMSGLSARKLRACAGDATSIGDRAGEEAKIGLNKEDVASEGDGHNGSGEAAGRGDGAAWNGDPDSDSDGATEVCGDTTV